MSQPKEKFLKDYKAPEFTIEEVELEFFIYDEYVDVLNVMTIQKKDAAQTHLKLDTLDLELLEIYLNDLKLKEYRYETGKEELVVFDVPERFTLTIKNRIYPDKNTELEGLYRSGDILCTQCEPEGFRRITPFIDRPDVMAKYTTTIVADKERFPILLSNGNKVQEREIGNKLEVTWEDPFPKPSYLFALVAGDLGSVSDSFTTRSGKTVELNIYTDKGNESRCNYAMDSLKRAMKWDEDVYDREYDLDIYNIVAVDSFNMGAMENKGLNIFNSAYVLADNEVATDRDFMGIESVISHEYFHNWTGNRITCRDWFQLTLKEGLTVFRDQCFSADMNSYDVQRIEDVKALRERQFVEDASPMAHPIQPKSYISMNNFYTATVYEKGAEVIRMIHTLIGKEGFKKGMDIYFERHDGQAVTTEDFIRCMEEGGGIDLTQFRLWYDQSGTPVLEVKEHFQEGRYSVKLTQHIPKSVDGKEQKEMFYPLKIALFDIDGSLMEEKTLQISNKEEVFVWEGLTAKPVLSLNRDFSAPIIVRYDADYANIAKFEVNGFAKFEALTQFGLKTVEKIIAEDEVDEAFIALYGYILQSDIEGLFKALLLELPTLTNVIADKENIDIDLYAEALDKLEKAVVTRYEVRFIELYRENHEPKNNAQDKASKAKRALKNFALEMLGTLKNQEIFELASRQYYNSVSMSDKLTALKVMDSIDHKQAERAFEDFYEKYHDNSLLMVKYFSIKASLDNEIVLQRIIELEKDKVFNKEVPNLVRALYGAFARNLKHFHKKDGSGYSFISQKIEELDGVNPQMAAALANSFKLYPKLNEENRSIIKEELERVVSTHSLSNNSFEIISKTLEK